MGFSRVLRAPQTGSISVHVFLSFSPNPIWWHVILVMSCNCAFQKPKIGKGITNIQKKIKILFFIKEKLMKIG
jgi:hypothetical protein